MAGDSPPGSPSTRRAVLAVLLGGLLILSYAVLQLFFVPIAWAAIIAYATWPLHARLRRLLRIGPTLSSLAMTLLLTAAFVAPLLWLIVLLREEVTAAYAAVSAFLARGSYALPDAIAAIPWLGERLQELLDTWASNPEAIRLQISEWLEERAGEILNILGDVGRNAAKLGFALLTLFFLFRDGEILLMQVRRVLRGFLGARVDDFSKRSAE